MKFKTSILLILLAMATLLFCACDDQAPVDTTTPDESLKDYEYIDPTENCANIYDVSATIQEQMRSDYDKYVDKDNNNWESNWKSSSLAPIAQVKIGVSNDATGNYTDNLNGMPALGVDTLNTTVPLMVILELLDDSIISDNNCKLNLESKRTYKGIESGAIGSGMLNIEKSYDNFDWSRIDSSEYQNGLFTTNYRTHYGNNPVLIYTPSGADLNHGVYVRITYIYEAEHTYIGKNIFGFDKEKTDDKMFREQSVFYLCNENIDAVTFHNLSLTNENFPDDVKDESGEVTEEFKRSETLLNDSMTVTGFKIDNMMSNVSISVSHNGYLVSIPETCEFTEHGEYDIIITQVLGKRQKHLKLYVDKRSAEEIKAYYFPEGFINGKRIYWEGDYPMFEGGLTQYSVLQTSSQNAPIFGTITNLTTGTQIPIFGDRSQKIGSLSEPGEYVATFCNNPTYDTETPAGDACFITYRFVLIANGTAPGPQVNKKILSDYMGTNVSDYNPKYYGVTYSSAGPGNITRVFTNYQDAFEFAYNYEKGCIEKQSDGSFRYSGTLAIGVKEKYNSLWDLTDATNYFAEQAVQEIFFDLTDEFTYLTIEKSILDDCKNLRTLELAKSVFVFANEDQRASALSGNTLPVIAAKKYQHLTPGLNGTVESDIHDFEFIKDENGYDSACVVIIDASGKEIPIEYNRGVAEQLKAAGCATGVITIKEETIYGDSTEYEAIFIADGVNTTTATISYYKDGQEHSVTVAQSIPFAKLEINAFSFESLKDELDPMALVKIIHNGIQKLYTFDEATTNIWNTVGEYSVIFINRLGYSYQIEFSIKESHFINITFKGEGADDLDSIIVSNGQTSILLPVLSRYGYELLGYEDELGNVYKGSIEKLNSDKDIVLSPIWQPKTIVLTVKDQNGNIIQTIPLEFGEEYLLIKPILSNGSKFVCWLMNGEALASDYITVTSEEDIEVIANIEFADIKDNEQNEENNNSFGIKLSLICGGIVVLFLLIFALSWRYKHKTIVRMEDDNENS